MTSAQPNRIYMAGSTLSYFTLSFHSKNLIGFTWPDLPCPILLFLSILKLLFALKIELFPICVYYILLFPVFSSINYRNASE